MKKFKFRFESVLKYKKILEEQKQIALAKHINKISECKQNIENLINEIAIQGNNLKEQTNKGIRADEIIMFQDYINKLLNDKKNNEFNLQKLESEKVKKQEELTEAMKERKIYDKLKEKDFEQYTIDLRKEEAKQIDETVIQRFKPLRKK